MTAVIHPLGYRLAVSESPVDLDEQQLPTGLIVKTTSPTTLKKGVVIELSPQLASEYPTTFGLLGPGSVIYYIRGEVIGDVVIVDGQDVKAWEE